MKKQNIQMGLLGLALLALCSCGGGGTSENKAENKQPTLEEVLKEAEKKEVHGTEIKEEEIKLSNPLDAKMVTAGQGIYDTKCASCHKLTDQRIVGPGWAGVTKKRKPVWIMNMITNVEMMLESDPEAQKLLEQCLVRMPNQNVNKEDARVILEFMRKNDGEK